VQKHFAQAWCMYYKVFARANFFPCTERALPRRGKKLRVKRLFARANAKQKLFARANANFAFARAHFYPGTVPPLYASCLCKKVFARLNLF